jgi:hypothetical protein
MDNHLTISWQLEHLFLPHVLCNRVGTFTLFYTLIHPTKKLEPIVTNLLPEAARDYAADQWRMSENCILYPCRATEVQHAYTLAGEKLDLTKAMDMLQLRRHGSGRTSVIGDMDSQILNMPSVEI